MKFKIKKYEKRTSLIRIKNYNNNNYNSKVKVNDKSWEQFYILKHSANIIYTYKNESIGYSVFNKCLIKFNEKMLFLLKYYTPQI